MEFWSKFFNVFILMSSYEIGQVSELQGPQFPSVCDEGVGLSRKCTHSRKYRNSLSLRATDCDWQASIYYACFLGVRLGVGWSGELKGLPTITSYVLVPAFEHQTVVSSHCSPLAGLREG